MQHRIYYVHERMLFLQTSLLRIAQVQIAMMGLIIIVKTWLVNGGCILSKDS